MNVTYIVFESRATRFRKILRGGSCPNHLIAAQAHQGELSVKGQADDRTQKIDMESGSAVIVPKTQAEIDRDNPKPPIIAPEDRIIRVKQKDWDALHARVDKLENP